MKKCIILFLVLLSLVCVSSSVLGNEKQIEDLTIGFANYHAGVNPYPSLYTKIFKEEVEKLGIETIILDARGNPATQIYQMNDLIAKKPDVIVLWPTDAKAIIPSCKKAKEAGIPIVVTNSKIDKSGNEYISAFTGPDNYDEGKKAAELMVEALNGKGKIVEITGAPGYETTISRHNGFMDEIKKYPEIEVIGSQPGNWSREDSQKAMENFLVRFSELDGVYCVDSNTAMGALNAIREEGRTNKIFITDATLFGEGYDAILKGEIYGSVYQSPIKDAKLAVEIAVKIALGKEVVSFYNYIETPKITLKNINEFERPIF